MKRNEQIWWLIIGIFILAVLEAASFHFTGNLKDENRRTTSNTVNSAVTFDLFTKFNPKESPVQNDNQTPEKAKQFYLQTASGPCSSHSLIIIRQTVPGWEKSLKNYELPILLCFFIVIAVVRTFTIFYRLARANPGDDWN